MPESPTVTAEPIGLAAAAAERQGAADHAEHQDAATGAAGAAPGGALGLGADEPSGDEWRPAVELALDTLDQAVLRWCPTWEPSRGPLREAGVSAWARYLQTVAEAPGPLAQALAFTAGRYAPPLWQGWQERRAAADDADGDDPRS